MKLKLKNFRCYTDKEFDFGENGLLLLSGPSGAGKSSILLAIQFALYGTGNKLITYGKTSCRVELTFEDINIVRTKRPNRVVVNNIHEDASAQAIIVEKFGKTFDVTGYIAQNAINSFVLMSPIEKLAFLEKFAFADIDLGALKGKTKNVIKNRNETLIATTSQLELVTNILNDMKKPETVKYPLKSSGNREKSMKNEFIRHKNSLILIQRHEKKITSLKEEINALQILNTKINMKSDSLNNILEKIQDISSKIKEISYDGDESLKLYEEQLKTVLSTKELTLLVKRYDEDIKRLDEMKKIELEEAQQKIENIEKNLWIEYKEDEIKTLVIEHKQLIKDLQELDSLYERLNGYNVNEDKLNEDILKLKTSKKDLELKDKLLKKLELQQELFKCPSCQETLKYHDGELIVADEEVIDDIDIDSVKKEVKNLKNIVSNLEYSIPREQLQVDRHRKISLKIQTIKNQYDDELPNLSEAEQDLDDLKEYKRSQLELTKQMNSIKTSISENKYSSNIVSFEKSLKTQKKKIKELSKICTEIDKDLDENELRTVIQTQKRNKERLYDFEKTLKILKNEKNSLQTEILKDKDEHIKIYKKINDMEDIKKKLDNEIIELRKQTKKCEKHANNVEKINLYKEYVKELKKYNDWVEKVDKLKEKETIDRKRYGAAITLREKILEAESIAMINIINSINTHVQNYLDLFFTDNPISARLLPFKESKKSTKKPQINIQIEYKGMEADLNMLSGGELSRVVLAYTLALGEIFNTPLMMLDECTASLDQDLTSDVIEGIKEHYADKMVIIIAHQVVNGAFDRIIKV